MKDNIDNIDNIGTYNEPKYTMSWLGMQCLYVFGLSFVLALTVTVIDGFASGRVASDLLLKSHYRLLSDSLGYCFVVIGITLLSITLIEVAFRRPVNFIQYALIALALALFYLLLLAVTEHLSFGLSYVIVAAMTIGLIGLFIKGITQNLKAVGLTVGILLLEYCLIYILISLGSMALLIGSISLFLLIALAMYFTLKLRVDNNELTFKK